MISLEEVIRVRGEWNVLRRAGFCHSGSADRDIRGIVCNALTETPEALVMTLSFFAKILHFPREVSENE